MRKLISALSGIVLVLFLVGCERIHTRQHLLDIESYIMERPDSALAVLDTMDRTLLVTDRLKAHHALLHAMALDKNYIDVTDDSIASVAVEYYSKKGPEKYNVRSLYYQGVVYYNQKKYDKAIINFTRAERLAQNVDTLYWAMLKGIQANVYTSTYNDREALKYLNESYEIYSTISLDYYKNVTELKLAKSYFNLNEKSRADSILQNLVDNPDIDENIKMAALSDIAFINVVKSEKNLKRATELYEDIMYNGDKSFLTYKDYWAYSFALSNIGRREESQDLVTQLLQVDSSATAYYWQYLIESSKGNYYEALTLLENFVTSNNIEVNEVLKQSLSLSQRDYYESQYEIAEYKAHNRKLTIISGLISSLFVIGLIYWVVSAYARRLREEKEYYLNYADEISRQLEASKNEDYPELKRKYIELYKSRFEIIGSLYEQYTLFDGKNNSEHAIYEKVSSIVEDFRNDYSNREQFESILNENMDNIVSRFRMEVPKLKEIDYSIFCFMLIGFDPTTISHLLNTTMNVIYIRKSRMKKRIETLNPEHKVQFLEVLN